MSTVYLNGVNINKYVVEGSLNIDDAIGERSTCQFVVRCPAGALDIKPGARVEIYTDNIRIFGGTVDNVDKAELLGTNPRYLEYSVQCTDWHQICDRRIVSEAYENISAGDIVQNIIEKYLASEGIIGNPAEPTFTRNGVAYLTDGTQVAANTPRFEQGRFGQAIMVEEGTTNLVSNPSFESGMWPELWNPPNGTATLVTGWNGSGNAVRITITKEDNMFGVVSARNMSLSEGVKYTISFRARAIRDNFPVTYMYLMSSSVGNSMLPTINLGTTWQRYTITYTIPAGKTASDYGLMIAIDSRHSAVYANDWIEVDDVQLEAKPYATSFIGGTRAAETLTIPTAGVLNPQEGTVECWVYVNDYLKTDYGSTKQIFWWATSTGRISMGWNVGGKWYAAVGNGTNNSIASIVDTLSVGWHLFTMRWSATELALLIDGGVQKATAPNPYLPSNVSGSASIGHMGSSLYVNTLIDDLRISSIARSDEEIAAAYQSGQPLPVDEWTTYKLDFDGNISNSAISIQEGPIVQQAVFNYVPATQCLDKLADLAGYTWWIDSSKRLHFCDRALYNAPFGIDEQSKIMRPKLSCNRDNYRNRQYIRAGKGTTDPQTETFKGNGVQKTFTVGFPIAKVPTIKVNGVTQTVGIKGVDTGKDWYWNKGDAVITQDEEATPLTESDTLQVTYQGFYDIIVLTDDYSAVLERQSVEGGTGLYEAVNEEPYAETSKAAFQSANALLKKYAKLGEVLSFDTLMPGLRAGQLLQVNLPILGAVGEFLIRKVQYRDIMGDKYDYLFSVEAVSCFAAETWTKFFKANLGQPKTYVIRENIQEQEVLIRLVQQSEHTSWTEEVVQTVLACPVPSENLYPSDTLYPC